MLIESIDHLFQICLLESHKMPYKDSQKSPPSPTLNVFEKKIDSTQFPGVNKRYYICFTGLPFYHF